MIRLEGVNLTRGSFSLREIRLSVPTGEYGVLMGPTASGKTSLLEAICGLRSIDSGSIRLDERYVETLDPARRGIGYVPQEASVFETMSVRRQIEMPMRLRGWSRRRVRKQVQNLASMLGIESLLVRRARGLSGGERQRVALARALSFGPEILLLDEPMSSLDDDTREQLYGALELVRSESNVTALHVTHSANEAARLGDVILRLEDGVVRRVGSPHERRRGANESLASEIDV